MGLIVYDLDRNLNPKPKTLPPYQNNWHWYLQRVKLDPLWMYVSISNMNFNVIQPQGQVLRFKFGGFANFGYLVPSLWHTIKSPTCNGVLQRGCIATYYATSSCILFNILFMKVTWMLGEREKSNVIHYPMLLELLVKQQLFFLRAVWHKYERIWMYVCKSGPCS